MFHTNIFFPVKILHYSIYFKLEVLKRFVARTGHDVHHGSTIFELLKYCVRTEIYLLIME